MTDYNSDVTELDGSALAFMGLALPEDWSVAYRHDPRDEGWFLVALVSDGEVLIYESELETEEEFSDSDLIEVCQDAVLDACKQEGV